MITMDTINTTNTMRDSITKKEVKRILLIEPPRTVPIEFMAKARPGVQPPIGLAYIAAVLEKNNFIVKILDAIVEDPQCHIGREIEPGIYRYGLDDADIIKHIKDFQPDVIGVSCTITTKYKDAKRLFKLIKSIDPNYITVTGGVHPTFDTKNVLSDSNLDYAVLGEADYSFLELMNFLNGELKFDDLDGIALRINHEIRIIPKTKAIENLDELPFPARHLIPNQKYWEVNLPQGEATRTPWATLVTSRGCPASCIYCSAPIMWGQKYRARSAEHVLGEIEYLIGKYDVKEFLILDDNFTFNKERTIKILDGIIDGIENKGWDMTWTTPNGIATYALDRDILERIKRSGCASITLAIESGCQRVVSKVIKKPLSLEKAEDIINIAKDVGLKTRAFFMLGTPGETKAEMDMTLEFAKKLGIDWLCFSITTPLPGTELFKTCWDNNYIDRNLDFNQILFGFTLIHTDEFDEDYINKLWQKANSLNFLENPNLREGGSVEQAIKDFKRVIRIAPGHELAHYALGLAYEKKNLTEEAIKEWKTVLSVNENNELAKAALSKYNQEV